MAEEAVHPARLPVAGVARVHHHHAVQEAREPDAGAQARRSASDDRDVVARPVGRPNSGGLAVALAVALALAVAPAVAARSHLASGLHDAREGRARRVPTPTWR